MNFSANNRKYWISVKIFLTISLTTSVVSSTDCTFCKDCLSARTLSLCFCEIKEVVQETQQYDPYWHRTTIKKDTLYKYLLCTNIEPYSVLGFQRDSNYKYITFLNNKLKTISSNYFTSITDIEQIFMNNSAIEKIQTGAFSSLSKLEVLQLENNKLVNISRGSLNSLISLKTLDLHQNEISSIEEESFTGLNSLEKLDLSYNKLSKIPGDLASSCGQLKELDLSFNFLKSIDFVDYSLSQLEILHLNHNEIKKISNLESTYIKFLYLQENYISNLNDSSLPLSLEKLFLGRNNISKLNGHLFENLGNLVSLDLSNNQIKNISVELFKNFKNLKVLDLSQNEIDIFTLGVFSGLINLQFLNVSYMKIKNIDMHTFIPLTHLQILDITHDNLDYFDLNLFKYLPNFKKIYMGGNKFSCSVVGSVISQSKIQNFSIIYKNNFKTENINGLPCRRNKEVQVKIDVTQYSHENVKENSSINNWNMQKEMMANFSSILQNNITNLLNSEKASFNNILTEFSKKSEIKKDELRNYQESLDSAKLFFKKVLTELNATNDAFNIMVKPDSTKFYTGSLAEYESNEENSTNLSSSVAISSLSNRMEKVCNSVFQIKVFLIIVTLMFIVIYIIKKISGCWKQRDKKTFDLTQEMPIMRNY